MGIISIEQTNRLYWLGRYTERTYTTLRLYMKSYDSMLDDLPRGYQEYCRRLEIPNIYGSKENFIRSYAYDKVNMNSIVSNLIRAYDNAIVLREEIGSETLSYIQLAIYDMNKAKISRAPLIEMQHIIDNILAFWGIVDDSIDSEQVRNIIKTGKRVERIDLYARLGLSRQELTREVHRLIPRIERCGIKYNEDRLNNLKKLVEEPEMDYYKIVNEVESIL